MDIDVAEKVESDDPDTAEQCQSIKAENISEKTDVENGPKLSKNQLKKQRKLERWQETKKERRKKEREKRKESKRKQIEERVSQGLSEILPSAKKMKMTDPGASDVKVVIDCAFYDLMTLPDVKKLLKQILRCYSENRKSGKPLQFYLSSISGRMKETMDELYQGYQNWDVHIKADSPDVAFGSENIVYLAAESDNILKELDPTKFYIIGGLVDHNHHKGICFKKVKENGWGHAQLPLGDSVTLNSRKVLAVNHVFEMILAYVRLRNWKEAISEVLPNRKVASYNPEPQPTISSSKGNADNLPSDRTENTELVIAKESSDNHEAKAAMLNDCNEPKTVTAKDSNKHEAEIHFTEFDSTEENSDKDMINPNMKCQSMENVTAQEIESNIGTRTTKDR